MLTRTTPLRRLGVNLLSVVLSVALASGCRSLRPVPPSKGGFQESIRPGDKVYVVMHDGTEIFLNVTAVTSDTLVGQSFAGSAQESPPPLTVPLSHIASIGRYEVSAGKTVLAIGLTLYAAAMIALVILLQSHPLPRDGRPPDRGAVPSR